MAAQEFFSTTCVLGPGPVGSDVNKDLGPKAKDTGHKVKAKAKTLGYQGQGQGLWSQGQGQGLEMSKPITKTEGQS